MLLSGEWKASEVAGSIMSFQVTSVL